VHIALNTRLANTFLYIHTCASAHVITCACAPLCMYACLCSHECVLMYNKMCSCKVCTCVHIRRSVFWFVYSAYVCVSYTCARTVRTNNAIWCSSLIDDKRDTTKQVRTFLTPLIYWINRE